MGRDKKIPNAMKRSEQHRKSRREKGQEKLKRRMAIKKAERGEGGEELRQARLAKNIPRTIDNTRIYDSSSYLTADPASLRAAEERAAAASRLVNEEEDEERDDEAMDEDEESEEEEEEDEGAATAQKAQKKMLKRKAEEEAEDGSDEEEDGEEEGEEEDAEEEEEESKKHEEAPVMTSPPRILLTTSPGATKATYQFCDELKNVFPGGEFFKRPKGRGFELGRVARWAAKRGYHACIVVNEDHKKPNAITLINLPAGPTAYFKLSSVQLSAEIYKHARPTAHSPELILNGFTTLLGNAVGRMFGQLFPALPQFRGRQVVTLHNQRDFLFFRRHRYAFASPTEAKLQEIGPRFTLKLRWMRKGLPGVKAADGRMAAGGDKGGDTEFAVDDSDDEDVAQQEKDDEAEAAAAMARGEITPNGQPIPALDEEQEYEWKWKPKMEVSRRTFFL